MNVLATLLGMLFSQLVAGYCPRLNQSLAKLTTPIAQRAKVKRSTEVNLRHFKSFTSSMLTLMLELEETVGTAGVNIDFTQLIC